jgi:hypothetical protein
MRTALKWIIAVAALVCMVWVLYRDFDTPHLPPAKTLNQETGEWSLVEPNSGGPKTNTENNTDNR